MKKFLLLSLLFVPLSGQASVFDLTDEELEPESQEVLIKKPEKYQRNESMIYDLNTNLGIKDQRRYTGTDRNRLSFAGLLNGNYEHPIDLFGAEVNMMRRSSRYHQIWYGAQLFQHRTQFDVVTRNPNSSGANSEGSFDRPGDAKNSILGLGLGVSYRFKLLLDFYPTEDVFETVDVFLNGIRFSESFANKTYSGYGLTTSYGLHKRSSTSFFYGGKFAYNLASVTRPAIANESKSNRSLSLGWLSVGFEFGFFY